MKVKMNYSIELGQVPFKVKEITEDVAAQLNTIAYAIQSLDTMNTKIFLEKINKVREKIFFADNQLNDCIEIIEGYQSTIENYSHLDKEDKNFNVGDPQPPNTHDHGDIDQNELSELQGSLSNLNEILKND